MIDLQLTDHFKLSEFTRTRHTEFAPGVHNAAIQFMGNLLAVARELEKVRLMFCRPVFITSGVRSVVLNNYVGGNMASQHILGQAADFVVEGFQDPTSMQFVFEWCKNHLEYRQLILEKPTGRKPWIHLGIPNGDGKREALIFDGAKYERA